MIRNHFKVGIVLVIIGCLAVTSVFIRRNRDMRALKQEIKENCNTYSIDVIFDPETKKITATQEISIINKFDKPFSKLYFHIYPNVFQSKDTTPFPKQDMKFAYPEGFLPGKADIKRISTVKGPLKFNVEGTDLEVILDKPLKPDEKIKIFFEFHCTIPPSQGRFGYGENTFSIANWYPILAVYDEKGWHKDPYYKIGDPFYSDIAIYNVNIKTPKGYIIAATGSLVNKKDDADATIWEYKTDLVRDFAWVVSDKFKVLEDKIDNVRVKSYYIQNDENGKKALEYAKNSIKVFNKLFGKYPYKDYSVVASDFYIGGMEYPNIVIIGHEFYDNLEILEYIIAHETAHQWWYGLVGNDQINEAWLDESLAEYSTMLYYEELYGKKISEKIYRKLILNPYKFYELANPPGVILKPLSKFNSWQDYGALVYSKGAIMLKELERRIGKGQFLKSLRVYYKNNKYKNVTTEDFIESINHITGTDWTDYIYKWLKGSESLDVAS